MLISKQKPAINFLIYKKFLLLLWSHNKCGSLRVFFFLFDEKEFCDSMAIPDFLIFYEQNQGLFKEESEYVSY